MAAYIKFIYIYLFYILIVNFIDILRYPFGRFSWRFPCLMLLAG